jgi:hypothetical protein
MHLSSLMHIFYQTTTPKPFKDKILAINICPKLSHFDQKAKLWSIYVWINQEPGQNLKNNPWKMKKRKEEKYGETHYEKILVWRFKSLT